MLFISKPVTILSMSGKNDDILNFLKELTQRRILGDELENALSPFNGTVLSLDLIFQSLTKCFGPQKDELYNEGYSLNCTAEESDLDLAVLFTKEDGEYVNSLQRGQEFAVIVKFIGYDQLYMKPIFGKVDDEPEIFEAEIEDITINQNPSQPLEETLVVSKHDSLSEPGPTKSKQESYSYKLAEPYNYGIDDTNTKFEDDSFGELEGSDKAMGLGCTLMFISVFLIIGSALAYFDGMNSSFFLKLGFIMFGLGFVFAFISVMIKKTSGNN